MTDKLSTSTLCFHMSNIKNKSVSVSALFLNSLIFLPEHGCPGSSAISANGFHPDLMRYGIL